MRIRILLVLTCILISGVSPVKAERIKISKIASFNQGKIETIDKETGKILWQEVHTYRTGMDKGRKYLLVNIEGNGYYDGSEEPLKWNVESYYFIDPYIVPYYSTKQIFSADDKLREVTTMYYDFEDMNAYLTRTDMTNGQTTKRTIGIQEDAVDRYIIGVVCISYPFEEKRDIDMHYVTDDPKMYSVTLSYIGEESVTVPAGTFACHKLELEMNLGLLSPIEIFIPHFYYYVSDTQFIKYDGLESGFGTSDVIIQLAEKAVEK